MQKKDLMDNKMIFGNRDDLAIEISIVQTVDSWVFGKFLLWINSSQIGDELDEAVDLKGCVNWLSDFVEATRNRCEPELVNCSLKEAWIEIEIPAVGLEYESKYSDSFSRFHISHIGMSSFDSVVVALVNDGLTKERFIWQSGRASVDEYTCQLGSLANVSKEVIAWFQGELAS